MTASPEEVLLVRETIGQRLRENAKAYPEDIAFIDGAQQCTWREADRLSDAIAERMRRSGVKKGTVLCFWSMNTVQLVLYLLGAMRLGAVPAVINYSYRALELRNVLKCVRAERLYLGESKKGSNYTAMALQVHGECYDLHGIEQIEGSLEALLDAYPEDLAPAQEANDPDVAACIAFTSGTTCVPKPALLSHFNMLSNARQFAARMRVNHEAGDVLFAPLPLFHCSGLTGLLAFSLVAGIPAIICRSFSAGEALRLIQTHRATVLMAVPSMLEMMAGHPDRPSRDLSSLRIGQTSGAGMAPEKIREVLTLLGFSRFTMAYGQTECSPLITATLYDDGWDKITTTVGKPLAFEEVRIWDLEHDCPAPDGQSGEIQVRGVNVMRGYLNSPEENARKFTADGWLKTTDAGYLDAEGYLHFVTRLSEVIIRHGENISPDEIESVITGYHPSIRRVKVVGVPQPLVGEEIGCLIVADEKTDPEAIRTFVRTQLASYKVPKYVYQVPQLAMTETGKIDSAAARKTLVRLIKEDSMRKEAHL